MSDFDRLLKDALRSAGDSHRPASTLSARSKFVAARRRRTLFTAATSVAVLTALLVTAVVAAPWDRNSGQTTVVGPIPVPSALPGDMMITTSLEVSQSPSAVDVDGAELYVGNSENTLVDVIDPEKNRVETTLNPFDYPSEGLPRIEILDVHDQILRASGDGWLTKATLGPRDGSPDSEDTMHGSWGGPISDFVVTDDHVFVAGPSPFSDSGESGIFKLAPPYDEPVGDGLELPEPARLDFGYGNLWAAQSIGHDWLTRIDPETLERTTVPEPGGFRNSIDSDLEVSVGAGSVWTHFPAQESLIRVDPATARISGQWPMAGRQAVIEATEDLGVFVMIHRSQTVSRLHRVDPASGEVLGEPLDFAGPGPFALEFGFRSLWVADQSKDKVYRIEVGEKASTEPEIVESETPTPDGSKPDRVDPKRGDMRRTDEGRLSALTELYNLLRERRVATKAVLSHLQRDKKRRPVAEIRNEIKVAEIRNQVKDLRERIELVRTRVQRLIDRINEHSPNAPGQP